MIDKSQQHSDVKVTKSQDKPDEELKGKISSESGDSCSNSMNFDEEVNKIEQSINKSARVET